MNWSLAIKLSAAAGVTLTILEFSLAAHIHGTVVEDPVSLSRVFATTALCVMALCLVTGLLGSLLSRFVGLSPAQALTAGVAAATIPAALYLGGVDIAWDHDLYQIWFLAGIPFGFLAGCLMIRGASPQLQRLAERMWPAIAPLALLTGLAQELRQDANLLGAPLPAAAALWTIGVIIIVAAVRRWPGVGHALTGGAMAAVLAVALGASVKPDLRRPSQLVAEAKTDAPPVILLTIDTLRQDALSLYGADTPTPAIDALGADGIVFDRAYSTAPWTFPALTSIHTGLSPWAHGVRDTFGRVPEGSPAIGPMLRDLGYSSAAIGNNAWLTPGGGAYPLSDAFDGRYLYWRTLIPQTRAQQFWEKTNPKVLGLNVSTEELGEYGSEWIRGHKEGPFLLWLHILDPHMPYDRVKEFPPAANPPPGIGPLYGRRLQAEFGKWRETPEIVDWARALYQSEVRLVDKAVGLVLQTLKDEGVYDKALIVFTSDHGDEFTRHGNFGHGRTLYDELVRVPLIVKPPASNAHLRVAGPVSTTAIAPTILDLVGIAFDERMFSYRSLRRDWEETAEGSAPAESAPVFMTGVITGEPAEAVVWKDYKFISWEDTGHEELYEMESDPHEQRNLIRDRPQLAAVGRALIAEHARKEAQRASERGFKAAHGRDLTTQEKDILRGLGYLQ